jgi:uncharacterized protein YcbX
LPTHALLKQVPLKPAHQSAMEKRQVICWEWKGIARDEGEEAAAWLTAFLGKPSRLVRFIGMPRAQCLEHC